MPAPTSAFRLVPILGIQAVGLACGIASVKLHSHFIPPAMLGAYGVFLTFMPLGEWVLNAGLNRYVLRNWAAAENRPAMMHQVLAHWIRRLPWVVLGGGLAGLAVEPLAPGSGLTAAVAAIIAGALLGLRSVLQAALQADRWHWTDLAISGTGSVGRSFVPPLLFAATGGAAAALWWGFGVHAVVAAIMAVWVLRAYLRRDTSSDTPELPTTYSGTLFIVLAVNTWVLMGINRWVVAGFHGEVAAGYFTLATSLAMILPRMLSNATLQFVRPDLFRWGNGPADQRSRLPARVDLIAGSYTVLSLVALVLVVVVAPHLVGPLIDPRYVPSLDWLLPIGSFGIALGTLPCYQQLLLAGNREKACGPMEITTGVILVLGSLISAGVSLTALQHWLTASPLAIWLVARSMARRAFRNPREESVA